MKIIQKKIEQKIIANNCPECFSNDTLLLAFYQKCIQNSFFKRTTDEITNTLKCSKCKSDIYPISWTEDIERVYEFYMKSINPSKSSLKLTKLSYGLIILIIIILISIIIMFKFPEEVKSLF